MRRILATLVLVTACSSGGGDSTAPKPVADVNLSVALATINVGQTTTITATAVDAAGATITGKTVTWTSSAPGVASVVGGVVTGVSAGQATITATIDAKSKGTVITVAPVGSPTCSGVTPVTVGVGEVRTLTGAERQQLCVSAGASGAEYVLIPFNNATSSTNVPLLLAATNTVAATGAPLSANASLSGFNVASFDAGLGERQAAFDRHMRQVEHDEFGPVLRSRARSALQRSVVGAPGSINPITGLPSTPAIGTGLRLNANGLDGCTNIQLRGGRVAAVSNLAIVVVDSAAPAGGYTDAEYQSFAVTFDTLVYGVDTAAFGKPFDMDGNGRVLIFFTNAVNQLTPANSTTGFVGGFFFPRDLFPVTANAQVPFGCAGSNQGEMFYMPVIDPNGTINPFFKDKVRNTKITISTLAHEFQHLINASRRIYVTVEEVDFLETWLNEAMSHVAEELMYYRASGLTPKSDLTLSLVTATQPRVDAINAYMLDNLSRLTQYLPATDVNSPYSSNDNLATRGASWQLLRYSLDQMPNAQNTYLKAMVDSPNGTANTNGLPIFNSVFGGVIVGGLQSAVRQQVIAQFFDNSGIAIDPKYSFPSWNFRSIMPGVRDGNNNPIFSYTSLSKSLVQGVNVTYTLTGGGAGYARFRVNANVVGGITPTSSGGAVPTSVELILIRTQ